MSDLTSVLANASASVAPPSFNGAAPSIGSNLNLAAAKKAGSDFEAYFLSQAFESMFSGVDTDPMFGGGSGESVYRSMMIQQYSKVAAQTGATGIGAEVTREILHMQEQAQRPS